ncbi:MAG: hypothetical protein ACRD1Z_12640, partial [Vicinamibacteria bacterium]
PIPSRPPPLPIVGEREIPTPPPESTDTRDEFVFWPLIAVLVVGESLVEFLQFVIALASS